MKRTLARTRLIRRIGLLGLLPEAVGLITLTYMPSGEPPRPVEEGGMSSLVPPRVLPTDPDAPETTTRILKDSILTLQAVDGARHRVHDALLVDAQQRF